MTVFTPDWKLTIAGTEYTDIAISDIQHQSGRTDIYTQPSPSYMQITLVALSGQTLPFAINDSFGLEVKNSSGTYVDLFGGDITDVTISVGAFGNIANVVNYTILAMGSLVKLAKEIYNGTISQDEDGNQISTLLSSVFAGSWNDVAAATTWDTYEATTQWQDAENQGLGEIDQPGLYTMSEQQNVIDTIYNLASNIANSAFGYFYEESNGDVGYADADHRANYLATNGYISLNANHALGSGLSTITRSADVRNDIYINYGSNYSSQVTATDATSVATYGYKAETINSLVFNAVDAQAIADRYILQRSLPFASFQSITFPITNPEIDDAGRDALLTLFMGMPVSIANLPSQISSGEFEGFVEGWSWSTRFNELFLTINLSAVFFSQGITRWDQVLATLTWNAVDAGLTWENATIVA
jgi:hypothetical protein